MNHWIHYVFLSVYVTIQNSAFCRLAPQKGRASAKNNPDQRNGKKNKPNKQHILPSGPLSAVVLVSVFIYLMSMLDYESTPPLGGVCPRCSYGITGTGSGFIFNSICLSLSLSLSFSLCPDFFFSPLSSEKNTTV